MSCSTGGQAYLPPPPPPSSKDEQWLMLLGILLCELAVGMITLGSSVQRYALIMIDPKRRNWCGCSWSTTVWAMGLATYFGGNVVFTCALAFAPASLCAALMATVVVANALISRVLLHERLARCDVHGGLLIMGGIALAASFAPYEPVEYNGADLADLYASAGSIVYLTLLAGAVVGLGALIISHERSEERRNRQRAAEHAEGREMALAAIAAADNAPLAKPPPQGEPPPALPQPPPATDGPTAQHDGADAAGDDRPASPPPSPPAATPPSAPPSAPSADVEAGGCESASADETQRGVAGGGADGVSAAREVLTGREALVASAINFAYPTVIGTLETLVQMMMKGGSSMLLLTFRGDSQLCFANFYAFLTAWALLSVAAIWWLRKGLLFLEVTRLLPIEYGVVTCTSVIGGLVIYQEHRFVPTSNLIYMSLGILLICAGCALVGKRKTMPKRYMPGRVAHDVVAHRMVPVLLMGRRRATAHTSITLVSREDRRELVERPSSASRRADAARASGITSGRSGAPRGSHGRGSGRARHAELSPEIVGDGAARVHVADDPVRTTRDVQHQQHRQQTDAGD